MRLRPYWKLEYISHVHLAGISLVMQISNPGASDECKETLGDRVTVCVATSDTCVGGLQGRELVLRVTEIVNTSYCYQRLSAGDVSSRIAMGDAGDHANRVLHLAHYEGDLVGCCSSTLQPPWTQPGCGHWGLLVVAAEAQGTGVASALVRAAEKRLKSHGRNMIQIEYEFTTGDAYSERLRAWYEGKCKFTCLSGLPRTGQSQFRRCLKPIPDISSHDSIGNAEHAPCPSSDSEDEPQNSSCGRRCILM